MSERRSDLRPALAVSGGLHLVVLLALLISWRFAPPPPRPLQAVAVSIVSNASVADVRPAEQAPQRQTAAEPEPTPSPEPPSPVEAPAPPAPAPPPPAPAPRPRPHPQPVPTPAPEPEPPPPPRPRPIHHTPKPIPKPMPEPAPEPKPKPKPEPKPQPRPKPAPRPKPQPTPEPSPEPTPPKTRPKVTPTPKAAPDLNLDSLSKPTAKSAQAKALNLDALSKSQAQKQSLDLTALSDTPGKGHAQKHASSLDLTALADAGGHRSSAAKGAARAETDKTARQAVGQAKGLDAASVGALKAKITRLWNPECGVKVDVRILLRADHSLATKPTILAHSTGDADDAKVASATAHALAAVQQAAPFTELPSNAPRDLVLHFTPTEGCAG